MADNASAFLDAVKAGDCSRVTAQLQEDASLIKSVNSANGQTALHIAAADGNADLIKVLSASKPDCAAFDSEKQSALSLAAQRKHHGAIKALLDAGADINQTLSSDGATALHRAAEKGNAETVKLMIGLGGKVSETPVEAGTLLHAAARSGDVNCVGSMVYEVQIGINAVDAQGESALFTALRLKMKDVFHFLLEHGAKVDVAATGKSASCLHLAVEVGTVDDVKALIAFGASQSKDKTGATPSQVAEKAGKADIVRELAKTPASPAKKLEDAARFKAHGNKVFSSGENVKAAKFYSLALSMDPSNHVFYSNRAACYFALGQHLTALWDAYRVIALQPTWPKGHVRKAATLSALGRYKDAMAAVQAGLAVDKGNADLAAIKTDLEKKMAVVS